MIRRRNRFFELIVSINVIAALSLIVLPSTPCHGGTPGLQWYNRPLRVIQTLLREPDIREYDTAAVVRYLEATHANCLVINGGGIIDFFPNDLPMANPNRFMGDRDILRELVARCRERQIRVIARVDFRGVDERRYRLKPEWFAVNADRSPKMRFGEYQTCFNGGYRNDYGMAVVRLLFERYDIDGIWYNAIHSPGACYCTECARRYQEHTGGAIPGIPDSDTDYLGPRMAEYRRLKAQWGQEHLQHVRSVVKSFGEEKALVAEVFGMYNVQIPRTGGIDLYTASRYFDFLIGNAFVDREQSSDPGYPGGFIRFLKTLDPGKQAVLLLGTNRNSHRLAAENPVEVQSAMYEAIGAGGGLWNAVIAGQYPEVFQDRRNAAVTFEPYAFLAGHEADFTGMQPVADVRIFYSGLTRDLFPDGFGDAIQGVERVLQERHIPYSFLTDQQVTAESLKDVKTLVLPDVAALSDSHIAVIREFVRRGGGLAASYRTSLYDTTGRQRRDFGFADVFGCTFSGKEFNTRNNCYQLIRSRHAVLEGRESTELLLNGGTTLACALPPDASAETVCTHVPEIRRQPPEYSWSADMRTDNPTLVVHRFGDGRVVYFANEIMRLSWTDGHQDFTDLLGNAIVYNMNAAPSLTTNAPPGLRCSLLADGQGRYLLTLINHTSAPYRPVRVLTPVAGVDITLATGGRTLQDYQVLYNEGDVHVTAAPGASDIRITLDRVQMFSVIALTLQ